MSAGMGVDHVTLYSCSQLHLVAPTFLIGPLQHQSALPWGSHPSQYLGGCSMWGWSAFVCQLIAP